MHWLNADPSLSVSLTGIVSRGRPEEIAMTTPARRQYIRIPFHDTARLSLGQAGTSCDVLDLSLKGALVALGSPLEAAPGTPCALHLPLDARNALRMNGHVVHREDRALGLEWDSIDLDSLTHLRRLLELNCGDEALINRELAHLVRTAP